MTAAQVAPGKGRLHFAEPLRQTNGSLSVCDSVRGKKTQLLGLCEKVCGEAGLLDPHFHEGVSASAK